jgi:hypothetical protein
LDDVERLWSPAEVFTPEISEGERMTRRGAWTETVRRVEKTIPELSDISF